MRDGFVQVLPLAFGVAVYGLAFGVLAAGAGFDPASVLAMGVLVFAGSSQIVAVASFASDASVVAALVAGLLLNLRYLAIGATLGPVLAGEPRAVRLLGVHLAADENWALTMAQAPDRRTGAFLIGAGLAVMLAWAGASTLGAWLGASIGDLERYGLGFAFTAAFIALTRGLWRGRATLVPWLVAGGSAVALVRLGASGPVATLVGAGAGALVSLVGRPRDRAGGGRGEAAGAAWAEETATNAGARP